MAMAMKKMITMRAMLGLLVGLALAAPGMAQDASKPLASASAPEAAVSTADNSSRPTTGFGERYPRYKIGAGDQFDVTFDLSPEFNQTVTVQPDGYVTLQIGRASCRERV